MSLNYGGRQQNNTSYIKQFFPGQNSSSPGVASWMYKKIHGSSNITPVNTTFDVYIPKDLIVNGSILNPSDRNLKENIVSLNHKFCDKILDITPVSFNYKGGVDTHYGFIAQDIPDELSNLVKSNNCNSHQNYNYDVSLSDPAVNDLEIKYVNYIETIALLIGTVKQMKADIDDLKTKVNCK